MNIRRKKISTLCGAGYTEPEWWLIAWLKASKAKQIRELERIYNLPGQEERP